MRYKRLWVIFWVFFCWFGIDFGREGWGQTNPRPLILGISHVAFQVPDFSKAIAFYQDILGYKAIRSRARNNQPAHLIFNVNDRQHLAVYAGLTAEQDERLLELALEVTDAEAMRLYLLRKGVKVPATLDQEPAGCLSFAVVDPENHTVRFIQHQHKSKHQRHRIKQPEPAVSDRILHVGLTVADVKKMDAFYQEILGFSEIWRGGRPDSVTNWINMRVPEGTDYIEYMLVPGLVNRQQLGVMHHVALQVPSIQNALDLLRKKVNGPEPYTLEAPRVGRNNRWQLNLYDPAGTRIELMEPFPIR